MHKQKILILISSLNSGGAERQAVQDANILSELGYQVYVCFGVQGPLKDQLEPPVHLFDLRTTSQPKAIFRLAKYIHKNQVDLVLSHMNWANQVGSVASIITRKKNIVFKHGLVFWKKWYHLLLMKKASKIITCSEKSKSIRINYVGLPSKKMEVIHNSFAVPLGNLVHEHKVPNLHNGVFTIGYAGRFSKVKQLHLLAEIALFMKTQVNDFQFVLLGDGDERARIENLVRQKGLGEHFRFMGYVSEPLAYLKQMNCFVLPSNCEDFSLALIEASYCRLPCVAFDVGGNREIISHGNTGWVVGPNDVKAMSEKIVWLKNHPEYMKHMGEMARQRVESCFSQKQRGQRLAVVIQAATK